MVVSIQVRRFMLAVVLTLLVALLVLALVAALLIGIERHRSELMIGIGTWCNNVNSMGIALDLYRRFASLH
jgi:hypothetical protein